MARKDATEQPGPRLTHEREDLLIALISTAPSAFGPVDPDQYVPERSTEDLSVVDRGQTAHWVAGAIKPEVAAIWADVAKRFEREVRPHWKELQSFYENHASPLAKKAVSEPGLQVQRAAEWAANVVREIAVVVHTVDESERDRFRKEAFVEQGYSNNIRRALFAAFVAEFRGYESEATWRAPMRSHLALEGWSDEVENFLHSTSYDIIGARMQDPEYPLPIRHPVWPTVVETVIRAVDDDQDFARAIEGNALTGAEQEVALHIGNIAVTRRQMEKVEAELDVSVLRAREAGVTWADVARAMKITQPSARRRWDADARQKHSDYKRRKEQRAANPGDEA